MKYLGIATFIIALISTPVYSKNIKLGKVTNYPGIEHRGTTIIIKKDHRDDRWGWWHPPHKRHPKLPCGRYGCNPIDPIWPLD